MSAHAPSGISAGSKPVLSPRITDAIAKLWRRCTAWLRGDTQPALQPSEPPSVAMVETAIRLRQERNAMFGIDLFGEPLWDILLNLYRAHLQEKPVPVAALGIVAGEGSKGTARHLHMLLARGLVEWQARPGAARDPLIGLTPSGARKMDMLFGQ